jgi:Flp pilus assembly protein TadG
MSEIRRFMNRLGAWCRDDRGAAAVEFALVLPLLLLILFGIIEFGRAWSVKQTLTDAAREGARIAVVSERFNLTTAQLEDSVRRTVTRAAETNALAVDKLVINPQVGGAPGTAAHVALTYDYVPLFGTWVLSEAALRMRTTFTMRNE